MLRASIWTLAGMLLAWIFILAVRHPFKPGDNTFSEFYYAGAAMRGGFATRTVPSGYIYPPFLAWVFQPLTRLPVATAYRVWLCFTFLLTSSSMLVGWRAISRYFQLKTDWTTGLTVIFAAFVLSAGEARTEWATGQCDGLVLDAFSFSLALLMTHPLVAGLVIALGANIKYQTLVLVPWLLWRGHFRAALAVVLGMVFVGCLPAWSMGWQRNLEAWSLATGGLGRFLGLHNHQVVHVHPLEWDCSISIPSALARMLHGPIPAWLISGLIATVGLWLAARWYRRAGLPLIGTIPAKLVVFEWSAVLLFLLAFGPQTTRRHGFILMLVHLAAAAILLLPVLTRRQRHLLLLALLIEQFCLRLPPSAGWCDAASEGWKYLGGPAWGMLVLLLVFLQIGAKINRPSNDNSVIG